MSVDLFINALIAGLLLGGFYAAVTVGISISFGILDIVNIAHPGFIILGSYIAYIVNDRFGIDPIATGIIVLPAFYALGAIVYQVYYASFEKRGQDPLRGLAFFFGLFFLTKTFIGRAIMAVAQDQLALQLMAADPIRIKRIAFAISIATCAMAGAFLIIIQPVEPSVGREYIGRVFAICVIGGLGSLPGTLIGAMLLGVVESFTATFYGPSWAPAVAFGLLLMTLAFRPAGIMGR